ncbi:hypothetical protein EJ07DRAFT_175649 [Lizonia empirigonia]|nr:hypothetical protein EJ07DRAFT_175649 [Lizonia empirigonia]
MSRKHTNTNQPLPVPAPENITNREYYRASEPTDAHDTDIEYPRSRTPSPEKRKVSTSESSGVRRQDVYGLVEVSKDMPASPSPSDIVADCDLADTMALSDLNCTTRDLPRAQRKTLLLNLQEELREERARKAEEDEREREEREERPEKECESP